MFPIACITTWAPPPVGSVVALDSHRSANSAVNWACSGPKLCISYENLRPDELSGAEAVMQELGNGCKNKSSFAERFDCTEAIINQLFTDISLLYQWGQVIINLHLVAGFKLESDTFICSWPAHYFIDNFHLCLFPALVSITFLVSPQVNPNQNE